MEKSGLPPDKGPEKTKEKTPEQKRQEELDALSKKMREWLAKQHEQHRKHTEKQNARKNKQAQ